MRMPSAVPARVSPTTPLSLTAFYKRIAPICSGTPSQVHSTWELRAVAAAVMNATSETLTDISVVIT